MSMQLVGSIGVALLLGAFAANLAGRLDASSVAYRVINALGAGIAAFASYGIEFWPFVVLEGTWCLVSLASLVGGARPEVDG